MLIRFLGQIFPDGYTALIMSPDPLRHFLKEDGSIDTESLFSSALFIGADEKIEKLFRARTGSALSAISFDQALERLTSELIELIVFALPGNTAGSHEFLEKMRQISGEIPVIVVVPPDNARSIPSLMRDGVWDFVETEGATPEEDVHSCVQRVARRKLEGMRRTQFQIERSAFAAAVRHAPDGLAILGQSGMIIFANEMFRSFCSLLSTGSEERRSIGSLLEGHAPTVAKLLQEQLARTDGGASGWHSEMKVTSEAAGLQYFELFLSSVSFAEASEFGIFSEIVSSSAPRLFVLWIRNVSGRKREEQLQRDLLSTTTHDLKSPLGSITLAAELLQNYSAHAASTNEGLIASIVASSRGCLDLIEDLLSANKIEAGRFLVSPHWEDVNETVDEVVHQFESTAKMKNVTISLAPIQSGLKIYVDRLGLARVISNLLSNAIKFTKMSGKVEVSARREESEVRISVRDTGPGIDPAQQSILFDRFSRLPRDGKIAGSGLGLFIVRSIVAAHGGRIDLESQVGVGSLFTVCFPDPQAPVTSAASPSRTDPKL